MEMDWKEFNMDVSMKQLINTIDSSIKRRNCLFIGQNEEETKQI